MRKITAYVSGMALLLFVFVAQASSPALTDAQIRGFIASMPDIQALGDQYPDIGDDEDDDDDVNFASPISSGIAKLRGHEAYAPLTRLVKQHGFSSPEQWGLVGDRVIRAFLATTMDETSASSRAQMAETLRQIDDNPGLSAEQKADMKQMMSGGMSFMQSLDKVPAADIKAIRPHLAELQRAMHVNADDD
jgi:hypothetical protein